MCFCENGADCSQWLTKQCEIMIRSEDVFWCESPMKETGVQRLVLMHVCIGVCQKGGTYLKEGPDVFVDCDSFLKCVLLYPAATV